MGVLLRSAVIIGVIFYLSPVRNEQPATTHKQGSDSITLSGTAGVLWQQLPDTAKETLANEFQKQLVETAAKNLLREKENPTPTTTTNSNTLPKKDAPRTRPPSG